MKHLLPLTVGFLLVFAPLATAQDRAAGNTLTYEQDVRPLLKTYCFQCHGEGDKLRGGLDLRLRLLLVRGGKSGPALRPGDRDGSLLYQRVSAGEMPPGKKKLSPDQIAVIGRWIAAGAPTAHAEPNEVSGFHITREEQAFWCFQAVHRPAIPAVQHPERVHTPIDAFLLARLESKGLSFSPEADRRTLIRRLSFDLLGLPPAPEQIDAFVADTTPDAYERLVDRLLASPRYGERWGRHWLDVAGYADSEGYSPDDPVRPHAYKYRDYVIRSLNDDKPFDQFIQEQLAGDELVRQPYQNLAPGDVERLVATGFLRMAPDGTSSPGVDQPLARNQVLAETLKIVSTSLMGLTVGCAQCHNHRYDPIPQSDYYRLRAIFEPAYDPTNWRPPPARRVSLATDADRQQAQKIEVEAAQIDQERLKKQQVYIDRTFEAELKKLPESVRPSVRAAHDAPPPKRTAEQQRILKEHPSVNVTAGSLYLYDARAAADLKQYVEHAAAVRATKPVEDFVRALTELPGRVPVTHLFSRGDHTQAREALTPGGLTVLEATDPLHIPERDPSLATTGRRLALARWLTDGRHPLTARVLVNRVWMHHFGRGLVGTPGDFGMLGERPTHPELLDWLADDFVAGGWHLKRLHRLLVTSMAYRQSSRRGPALDRVDPEGRLYSRMSLRRLEAEEVRDGILAVSGHLNIKMYGTPVPVMEDEVGQFVVGIENKNGENRPGPVIPLHGEEFRRSVYVQVRRSRPLALLETFDAPIMEPNCPARNSSTVAPQALLFLNNEFVVSEAQAFAERVCREVGPEPRAQVVRAWRLAFGSEPADAEVKQALTFLTEQAGHFRQKAAPNTKLDPARQALACLCQALLSANRFLYVD
jgi:mono/diheme cytochrome c family protein